MILTEEEAKTKWCPEARCGNASGANRSGPQHDFAATPFCIGSACMAWRWNGESPAFPGAGPEDNLNPAGRGGYCGKAGKP